MCCCVNDISIRNIPNVFCHIYKLHLRNSARNKNITKPIKFDVDTRNSLNAWEHTYLNLLMANVNIDVLQQVTN